MSNRNQIASNEMATTKTKYQTDFYPVEKYQYLPKFLEENTQDTDKKNKKFGTVIPNTTLLSIFSLYPILLLLIDITKPAPPSLPQFGRVRLEQKRNRKNQMSGDGHVEAEEEEADDKLLLVPDPDSEKKAREVGY